MRISVDTSAAERMLRGLADRMRPEASLRYAAQKASEMLERESKGEAFSRQADPFTSKPWAKRAGNRDPGRAILIKTGTLRRSITTHATITGRRVTVLLDVLGNAASYGYKHQLGLEGMPVRRFLGYSQRAVMRLLSDLERHYAAELKDGSSRSGGRSL